MRCPIALMGEHMVHEVTGENDGIEFASSGRFVDIGKETRDALVRRVELFPEFGRVTVDPFGDANIYVTCQTDDDLPYVLQHSGTRSLVIGTDYGHIDPSSEVDAISVFKEDERISDETKEQILFHNPKRLYAI